MKETSETKENEPANVNENKNKNKSLLALRLILLSAALGLMIFGLSQGNEREVMNRAIRICYECIGIG